jgi:hypothetical protein
MFTITWNPRGFHVIDKLPDGVTMNANSFTENIMRRLKKNIPGWKGGAGKATCRAYGQCSRSQLWDDNKFPCKSQFGATPALAGSRSERPLHISDSERKTKRY